LNIINLGYHSHLKDQIASNNPNLIKFLLSLHMEAEKIDMTCKLLSDTASHEHKLHALWRDFNNQLIGSKELLAKLNKLSKKRDKQEWEALAAAEEPQNVESD
jgi:hypothetical protein